MTRSLRTHLLAWLALASVTATVLTVVVAGILVRHRVEDQVRTTLARQADALQAASSQRRGPLAGGPPPFVRLFLQNEGTVTPSPPGFAVAIRRFFASHAAEGNGRFGSLLYSARQTPEGSVVLVREAGLAASDWRPFLTSLLLAGAGGAGVAALLALLLSRRLAAPVARLSAATTAVASGAGDARVPVGGPREIADLSASFNRMAADLSAAREADRAFLMSVSHELKSPVTAVRGWAEGLADGAVEPLEAATVIGAEAARLERLVGDLLELARLERSEFAVVPAPVDLAAVVAQVVERQAPRARELGVVLHADPGAGAATADGGRLLQVVGNLVENALRVTPAGGTVHVAAAEAAITVRDDGPGIAPEDLPRAFERFYLHDRYGTDRSDGTGLGLALVRELTTAMGGEVVVTSTPGAGALFTISLPEAI